MYGAGHRPNRARTKFNIAQLRYHKNASVKMPMPDRATVRIIRTLLAEAVLLRGRMPELIEGGYLYIAQARQPLQGQPRKVRVYLKDRGGPGRLPESRWASTGRSSPGQWEENHRAGLKARGRRGAGS